MALTDEQLELLGSRLVPLYQELEQEVIADIARRVKKTGRYTETAEIMAKSLMEQGFSPAKIRAEVMRMLRADKEYKKMVDQNTLEYKQEITDKIHAIEQKARMEGNTIVAEAGMMSYNNDLSMWEQAGKSLKEPNEFEQLIIAMQEHTAGELMNLTRTTGFRGLGFTSLENAYTHQLDLGLVKLTSGAFSWQQVVDDCIRELAKSGLRQIDYKNGRSMQIDTAVRLCVRTASSQLAGQVTMLNMKTTGEQLVEVSSHWGARTDGSKGHSDHAYWQGKVYALDHKEHTEESRRLGYTIKNLEDVTGYPSDPAGLCGFNCRHTMYPFFEGISEPNVWDPEPDPVEFRGKEYTYYQATQKQRQMERQIRATKREIEARKALGEETGELRNQLQRQSQEYHYFSDAMGIRAKDERLKVQVGSSNLKKTKAYKKLNAEVKGKKVGNADYLIKEHISGQDIEKEKKIINEVVSALPKKVQEAIRKGTIIDIGQIGASEYDYTRDILYVAKGAGKDAVIHEIGHLVENKMLDADKVKRIREKILGEVDIWGIKSEIYYDASGGAHDILLVENEKFVSEYQGRIYADSIWDAFDEDGAFRQDLLWEFTSEPFREYIENPDNLKEKSMELYELIREAVE